MAEKIKIRKTIQATMTIEYACCSSDAKGDRIWIYVDPKMCKLHEDLGWTKKRRKYDGDATIVIVPYKNYKIYVVWEPFKAIKAEKLSCVKEGDRVMLKYKPSRILKVVDMSGERCFVDCSLFDIVLEVECTARQDDGLFEDAYNQEIKALNKFKNR